MTLYQRTTVFSHLYYIKSNASDEQFSILKRELNIVSNLPSFSSHDQFTFNVPIQLHDKFNKKDVRTKFQSSCKKNHEERSFELSASLLNNIRFDRLGIRF